MVLFPIRMENRTIFRISGLVWMSHVSRCRCVLHHRQNAKGFLTFGGHGFPYIPYIEH